MSAETASVEVLTAEVRTLMVGNRQVTLSVYRQLDYVDPANMTPFGRVNDDRDERNSTGGLFTIGAHKGTGALVRSSMEPPLVPGVDVTDLVVQHRGLPLAAGCSMKFDGFRADLMVKTVIVKPCDVEGCEISCEQFGWHFVDRPELRPWIEQRVNNVRREFGPSVERYASWEELPLIVLAGLR